MHHPNPSSNEDLERFVQPLRDHLDDVVAELTDGQKQTHWMWFTFPQLRVLGRSDTARRYGLVDIDDARRFLRHGELGATYERLVGIVHDVVVVKGENIHDVFGSPDDYKLVSSLTLFRAAAELEHRDTLAQRCSELLDVATHQHLPPCAVTLAEIGPTT